MQTFSKTEAAAVKKLKKNLKILFYFLWKFKFLFSFLFIQVFSVFRVFLICEWWDKYVFCVWRIDLKMSTINKNNKKQVVERWWVFWWVGGLIWVEVLFNLGYKFCTIFIYKNFFFSESNHHYPTDIFHLFKNENISQFCWKLSYPVTHRFYFLRQEKNSHSESVILINFFLFIFWYRLMLIN